MGTKRCNRDGKWRFWVGLTVMLVLLIFGQKAGLNQTDPVEAGKAESINANPSNISPESSYGVIYKRAIQVPESGYYTFYIKTGQKGRLLVDGKRLVDVEDDNRRFGRYGIIGLMEGEHTIEVRYLNEGKGDNLEVQWSGPGFFRQHL